MDREASNDGRGRRAPERLALRSVALWLPVSIALALLPARGGSDEPDGTAAFDWSGRWNTVWATGVVQLELAQEGGVVTGSYAPGEGRIDAWTDGPLLRGRWTQVGASGRFVFAMARDGQTFAGRYEGDLYWNGERVATDAPAEIGYGGSSTPEAALRSLLRGINATATGDLGATFLWDQLLDYGDAPGDARARKLRRETLHEIIDLSTFSVADAPVANEAGPPGTAPGGSASVELPIGPAGSRERYALELRRTADGRWRVVVDPIGRLRDVRDRFLDTRGAESHEAWRLESAESPRGVLRRFVEASADPETFSIDDVVGTLDLAFLPPALRSFEAPLYVDYLRHVLARTGDIVWQEVPDDPERVAPWTHYRHPLGSVAIEPSVLEDGERVWRFGEETLRRVDELHTALQTLPPPDEGEPIRPLSEFFVLRERAAALSPALLERHGALELWQWLAAVLVPGAALLVAVLLGALLTRALLRPPRDGDGSAADADAEVAAREARTFARLRRWLALALVAGACFVAAGKLGLPDEVAGGIGRLTAIAAAAGAGLFALVAVGIVASRLARRAAATSSVVDEIVFSLVGGLARLLVVVVTFLAIADIAGLPYEGVIAGLGVGGIAIAIAARETISNFIGAATLLADRPFKRGDVVETADGTKARVLDVGLRSTKLRRHDDAVMMVPNALLANEVITNRGVRVRRQIYLTIGLTYDTPREKLDAFVENLRATWLRQERADRSDYYIGLKNFGTSSIDIVFWGYAIVKNRAEQFVAEHAFVGDIVDCARETGVDFAFPTRTVHVAGDGAADARPPRAVFAREPSPETERDAAL